MGRKLVEKRKRGIFGWLFLLLFWGWNGLMAWAFVAGVVGTSGQYASLTSEAERSGHAIGTALGMSMILGMWASGAIILGLLALLTRGKRELIEVETP